jgi:hypothetical protein
VSGVVVSPVGHSQVLGGKLDLHNTFSFPGGFTPAMKSWEAAGDCFSALGVPLLFFSIVIIGQFPRFFNSHNPSDSSGSPPIFCAFPPDFCKILSFALQNNPVFPAKIVKIPESSCKKAPALASAGAF